MTRRERSPSGDEIADIVRALEVVLRRLEQLERRVQLLERQP